MRKDSIERDSKGRFVKGVSIPTEWKDKLSYNMRGERNHFYGKRHTEEVIKIIRDKRLKQSPTFLGKKHTDETKKKISLNCKGKHTGEAHQFWKGGITPVNEMIRKSPEYKKWRLSVFSRDKYTCVLCGKNKGELQADHIEPFFLYPEKRFDINNGRTLCISCHRSTDTYGNKLFMSNRKSNVEVELVR